MEEKIIKLIKPHSLRCRPGDWNHANRVVHWVKVLGEGNPDLNLLVIAGYIHDIGWRDLIHSDKITFEQLLELEPQANKNSEPFIREILVELDLSEADVQKILSFVAAADNHESQNDAEAIIVDADSLSKLTIDHLKEKFKPSEWMKMYELWADLLPKRTVIEKAKELYPNLLENLKKEILLPKSFE